MNWKDEDLPVLHAFESSILGLSRQNPDMTDYAAARAYKTAFRVCRARARGQTLPSHGLAGLDLAAYSAIEPLCEVLLSAGVPASKGMPTGNTGPVPLERLLDYLRGLHASVERHTKSGGSRGYLIFLERFIRDT